MKNMFWNENERKGKSEIKEGYAWGEDQFIAAAAANEKQIKSDKVQCAGIPTAF